MALFQCPDQSIYELHPSKTNNNQESLCEWFFVTDLIISLPFLALLYYGTNIVYDANIYYFVAIYIVIYIYNYYMRHKCCKNLTQNTLKDN